MKPLRIIIFALALLMATTAARAGDGDFSIVLSRKDGSARVLACRTPEFSFHFPHMAGNLRFGAVRGDESLWTEEFESVTVECKGGMLIYRCKDPLLGREGLVVRVSALSDSDGLVIEVESGRTEPGLALVWAFGGCYGRVLEDASQSHLDPVYCRYNVFSVEGTAFSAYYGESMNLKIIQGVTPPGSDIRLSDARSLQSPLTLFGSGKRTDAPMLSGMLPVEEGGRYYFCVYTQNEKADYNYFMLPALFERETGR